MLPNEQLRPLKVSQDFYINLLPLYPAPGSPNLILITGTVTERKKKMDNCLFQVKPSERPEWGRAKNFSGLQILMSRVLTSRYHSLGCLALYSKTVYKKLRVLEKRSTLFSFMEWVHKLVVDPLSDSKSFGQARVFLHNTLPILEGSTKAKYLPGTEVIIRIHQILSGMLLPLQWSNIKTERI